VENAVSTPDVEQPWAELGLSADEYQRIREILGRRPTGGELAMYSVMWGAMLLQIIEEIPAPIR